MTVGTGAIAGSTSAARDLAAWQAVRADASIQYAPVPPPPTPEPPEWLLALSRFLERVLGPLGEALGLNWPAFKWVLIVLAAAGALWIAWALVVRPWLERRRVAPSALQWVPERDQAIALLEDADRLAAAGRFDEAAHLLLERSVGQIAAARPGSLSPASTAREIGRNAALPERARNAFGTIAQLVERSLFGLRGLGEPDWRTARAAYADFALAELAA
ncbi:MAG TPA: DUF4129 domain-containing protein [Novosphingobium sp.]|nr:DUF4129 domain-containing protein [Novosphingobium sp.]